MSSLILDSEAVPYYTLYLRGLGRLGFVPRSSELGAVRAPALEYIRVYRVSICRAYARGGNDSDSNSKVCLTYLCAS
jgi:hypothetical protein